MVSGIWLLQLGTPDSPTTRDCRKYLREFLSDPYVIDISAPLRWMLVNFVIAPFRSPKTAEAYQKIWGKPCPGKSPLLYYSEELERSVQKYFSHRAIVQLSMRYQHPSMSSGWERLRSAGVDNLLVVPLYPQYSSAATESSIKKAEQLISGRAKIKIFPPFYDEDFFLNALVEHAVHQGVDQCDHVLFSFHGIPERQIKKSDPSSTRCLLDPHCCERSEKNPTCYRYQSFQTAHALAKKLQLTSTQYSISFQSRLGRTPWLKPFTDHRLIELAQSGVKKLAIFSPSFVADCLETLEEIGIRGRASFLANGGEELRLIEAPNNDPKWTLGLCAALEKSLG